MPYTVGNGVGASDFRNHKPSPSKSQSIFCHDQLNIGHIENKDQSTAFIKQCRSFSTTLLTNGNY